MYTALAIIGLVFIVFVLYILKDTILEGLSGGESFAPNELKSFK